MKQSPFSSSAFPTGAIVAGALALGIAGDLLLRDTRGPGLNIFLLFGVLAMAVVVVVVRAGRRPSDEAILWFAGGLLFALAFVLRAAEALHMFAFLAAAAAFALPALYAGAAWVRNGALSDHVEAIGGAILHAGLGPLHLMVDGLQGPRPIREGAEGSEPSRPPAAGWGVVRGLVLAVPPLFVFGALFVSADRVFAGFAADLLGSIDAERLASHLLVIGVIAWPASGYLSGLATGTRVRDWLGIPISRPSIGILEAGTALALVDLLFTAFVLVQLRYLFGGGALVDVTPGLTYAEYAREGFEQLVVAAGLVLPLLLASALLVRRDSRGQEQVFRALAAIQLLLLLVVIASAVQRVGAYQEAYGLTEPRFYGAAFLVWLTFLAVWFGLTILRGREDRFAFPAVLSGFAFVAVLLVVNPDARIANTNLSRAAEIDAAYLGALSADAVPVLVDGLPALAAAERCTLARALLRRWGGDAPPEWRSWNLAEARARRLVPADVPTWAQGCPAPDE